jgi:hypothetical protein
MQHAVLGLLCVMPVYKLLLDITELQRMHVQTLPHTDMLVRIFVISFCFMEVLLRITLHIEIKLSQCHFFYVFQC